MARCLLLDTLAAIEDGRADAMLRVLECKAAAGEAATEVTDLAMRVCGGARSARRSASSALPRRARRDGDGARPPTQLYDFIGKAVCGLPVF